MELAAQRLKDSQKDPKVKAGEVSFDTNIAMGLKFADKLKTAVKRSGTWESGWTPEWLGGNDADAATLRAIPYQLAINYAKIVDPDSVAREGEVDAAQKYLIDIGVTSNQKAVLQQINHMEATIKEYASTRRGLSDMTGKAPKSSTEPSAPSLNALPDGFMIKTVRFEGKLQRALVGPDGIPRHLPPGM
jgi:hypothetical protein